MQVRKILILLMFLTRNNIAKREMHGKWGICKLPLLQGHMRHITYGEDNKVHDRLNFLLRRHRITVRRRHSKLQRRWRWRRYKFFQYKLEKKKKNRLGRARALLRPCQTPRQHQWRVEFSTPFTTASASSPPPLRLSISVLTRNPRKSATEIQSISPFPMARCTAHVALRALRMQRSLSSSLLRFIT